MITRGFDFQRAWKLAGLAVLFVAGVYLASFLPSADWLQIYDQVPRLVLQGHSPYDQQFFTNPPWTVLFLFPFAILPSSLSRGLIFVLCVLALIFMAWRLRAGRIALIAVLLSPTVIGSLIAGSFDLLLLPALFLPPALGLFILLIKPQVGVGVAVYYGALAWRKGGLIALLRVFSPVAGAFLVSAMIFPDWINRLLNMPDTVWNRSLFPFSVPVGLYCLWLAIRRKNVFYALLASPFLSPFITFYSYLVVQIALLNEEAEQVISRDLLHLGLAAFFWIIMLGFKL